MADITRFFRALSERAYKENNLSDITYAMCEADLKFRQYFLDFFFRHARLDAKEVTIEREHYDRQGRPDFWIEKPKDKTPFIVEVKIWDGKHHFEDYFKILSKGDKVTVESNAWKRLGYIANYSSIKDVPLVGNTRVGEVCRVATWKEFVKGIEHYACYDDPIVAAYVEYVKRVCPFDDFSVCEGWKIDVKDFLDIRRFEENVDAAINDASRYGCKLYRTARRFRSQQWMGQYFEWTIGGNSSLSGKTVWGWLGVYYKNGGAVVCVEFENKPGWGKEICERYANIANDGYLRFCSKHSNGIATDKQKLISFFNNVLQTLQNGNDISADNANLPFCTDWDDKQLDDTQSQSKFLLSMKCLPFVLENYLVTEPFERDVANAGYEFSIVHGNDEEVPESHCGRYFELRRLKNNGAPNDNADKIDEEKLPTYRGWIGVDYNANCHRLNKDGSSRADYGAEPSFVIEIAKDFSGAASLDENSWGWKYCEITNDAMQYEKAMESVRQQLLCLCAKSNATE